MMVLVSMSGWLVSAVSLGYAVVQGRKASRTLAEVRAAVHAVHAHVKGEATS